MSLSALPVSFLIALTVPSLLTYLSGRSVDKVPPHRATITPWSIAATSFGSAAIANRLIDDNDDDGTTFTNRLLLSGVQARSNKLAMFVGHTEISAVYLICYALQPLGGLCFG